MDNDSGYKGNGIDSSHPDCILTGSPPIGKSIFLKRKYGFNDIPGGSSSRKPIYRKRTMMYRGQRVLGPGRR